MGGDILKLAGTTMEEVRDAGSVILMNADFNCNFDKSIVDCSPTWKMTRIDNFGGDFSEGFNYYQTKYYGSPSPDSSSLRTVLKRYGIKLQVVVSGQAGKFNIVQLSIALGSGLAYLSLATLLTDFVIQHFMGKKKGNEYVAHKYEAF